jgi:hypothetical protein
MVFVMQKFNDYDIYKFMSQPDWHIKNILNYFAAQIDFDEQHSKSNGG